MKKAISLLLASLMLLALLCGCNQQSSEKPSSSASGSASGNKIAICMGQMNHPVHRIAQAGFVTKGLALGYDASIVGLDEGSTQELISKFESAVTNGTSGIMLWTGDDAMYTMMKSLADQCKFVVPHFAHSYTDTKDFISRNICALAASYGKDAADYLMEKLKEKGITSGTIGITQAAGNVTENAVSDAFRAEVEATGSGFKCTATVYEGLELSSAATKVTGIIQSNPDIVGALGTTGGSAKSWATAMENTSKMGIVVVAMDYTEINIDLVADGTIAAVVAQPLFEEGEMSAVALDEIFRGTDFTVSADQWFQQLEAPLIYKDGEGVHDVESYYSIIDKVIAFFSD